MMKIPLDFLHLSWEKSPNLSLGERVEVMSTVSMQSCFMKVDFLLKGVVLSFCLLIFFMLIIYASKLLVANNVLDLQLTGTSAKEKLSFQLPYNSGAVVCIMKKVLFF